MNQQFIDESKNDQSMDASYYASNRENIQPHNLLIDDEDIEKKGILQNSQSRQQWNNQIVEMGPDQVTNRSQTELKGQNFYNSTNKIAPTSTPLKSSVPYGGVDGKVLQTKLSLIQDWWPMLIGKGEDEEAQIDKLTRPTEYDVFPLSIYYDRKSQGWMRFYRLIMLLACIYVISPISVLYKNRSIRLNYFGNEDLDFDISLTEMTSNQFDLNITNCKLYWHSNNKPDKIRFRAAYDFNAEVETDHHSFLSINSDLSSKVNCIVNIYFPTNVTLPYFKIYTNGTQDNMLIDDEDLHQVGLNFTGLSIIGETAFINLHKHYIKEFIIDVSYCICTLFHVTSLQRKVNIYTGLYNEHINPIVKSLNITAQQNQGHICLSAPYVHTSINDLGCIESNNETDYAEFYDVMGIFNTTCTQVVTLCSTQKCAKFDSQYEIQIQDGPLQIELTPLNYTGSIEEFQVNEKVVDHDKLQTNLVSSTFIKSSANIYTEDTVNDRISIYQTIGVDYANTWLYTNKKPYLNALIWPLSWASLSLLKPDEEKRKIIIIDHYCPARGLTKETHFDMSEFYKASLPNQEQTSVALIIGISRYFEAVKDKYGEIQITQINFFANPLMVAAFILALLIGLTGAGFILSIFYHSFKIGKRQYSRYIEQQRHLAFTRQQAVLIETRGVGNISTQIYEQSQIVEIRGLFTAHYEKATQKLLQQKKSFSQINFSLFQVPALYMDFLFRKRTNSLQAFLKAIDESRYHFTPQKMKQSDKEDVSIAIEDFEKVYANFCQRNGYNQVNILDYEHIFEHFQLEVDTMEEKQLPGYIYLRFKTQKEKEQQVTSYDDGQKNESLIKTFLNEQCVQSSFKADYILVDDLQKAFIKYCDLKNKPPSERQELINSEELKSFGAIIEFVTPSIRIVGVKKGKIEKKAVKDSRNNNLGLIRKPINLGNQNCCSKFNRGIYNFMTSLFETNQPLYNFAVTLFHFVMIIIIPLFYAAICYFALSEISKYQQNVFAEYISFDAIAYANRLDPFFEKMPYFTYFYYAQIYLALYAIFAFLEILSFYLTNYDNQGKFPVKYSILKKIQTTLYQFTLLILIYAILVYIIMVLVWAILGAIMNPPKFLPWATGSIAFVTTLSAKYLYYQTKYQNVIKSVQPAISGLLNSIVGQSISKLQSLLESNGSGPQDQQNFKQKIAYFSDMKDFFKMDDSDEIDDFSGLCNAQQLSRVTTGKLGGLNPLIIETCLAIQANNKLQLYNSLSNLAGELDMDKDLIENIAAISLSSYNPDQYGIRETNGILVVQAKRLFRRLFRHLNVEQFGDLIQLVTEGDTMPLLNFLQGMNFAYKNLFEAVAYSLFAADKSRILQQKLLEFVKQITSGDKNNEDYFNNFNVLYKLQFGDISLLCEDLDSQIETCKEINIMESLGQQGIANKVGFQNNFPLMCLLALQRQNSKLSRLTINQTFKEVITLRKVVDPNLLICDVKQGEQSKYFTKASMLYQSLFLIVKGKNIDFSKINTIDKCKVYKNNLEAFYQVGIQNTKSFDFILNLLQCTSKKELLIEFYTLIQEKDIIPLKFCSTFGIPIGEGKIVGLYLIILFRILKFEKIVKSYDEKMSLSGKEKAQMNEIVTSLIDNILQLQDLTNCFKVLNMRDTLRDYVQASNINNVRINSSSDSLNDSMNSQGNEQELQDQNEQLLELEANDDFAGARNFKELRQLLISILVPNSKNLKENGKKGYKALWDYITNTVVIKELMDDDAYQTIRSYAIVMLRIQNFLKSDDKDYIKCYKFLAQFFDTTNEKMELIIDSIAGNPLEIFKMNSKDYVFDPHSLTFINGSFDSTRLNLITMIFQSDSNSAIKVCAYWYQEYILIQQAENNLLTLQRLLNINKDYIKIIEQYNIKISENSEGLDEEYYNGLVMQFIKRGLSRGKKYIKNPQESTLYTDKIFLQQNVNSVNNKQVQDGNSKYYFEDYQEFILDENSYTIMQELMEFKQAKEKIMHKFMNFLRIGNNQIPITSNNFTQILASLLKVSIKNTPDQALRFLNKVSSMIPLYDRLNDDESLKNSKVSLKNQNLFIQLNLILNSYYLQYNCRNSTFNQGYMNYEINKIISVCNRSKILGPNINYEDQENYDNIIKNLYDQNYFMDIAQKLFGKIGNFTQEQCNQFLGLIIGATTQNSEMIMSSIVNLLSTHSVNTLFIKGLAGILMNDLSASQEINLLARQLDLDGSLLINMLDLISSQTKHLPQVIYSLFSSEQNEQSLLLTSLIFAIKQDVNNLKPIASILRIDQNLLTNVLSAASGKGTMIETFYEDLSQTFKIQNPTTVKYAIELSNGVTDCISVLENKKSKLFKISQPQLFQNILYLINTGNMVYGSSSNSGDETLQLDGAIALVFNRLNDAFQFTTNNNAINKNQSKKLQNALKILLNACWGDQQSMEIIYQKLISGKKDFKDIAYNPYSNNNVNATLWNQKQEQSPNMQNFDENYQIASNNFKNLENKSKKKVLHNKLIQIIQNNTQASAQINTNWKSMIKTLKNTILPLFVHLALGKEQNAPQLKQNNVQEKKQEGLRQAQNNNEKQQQSPKEQLLNALSIFDSEGEEVSAGMSIFEIASKIGCTFGTTLFKSTQQSYFECITCNEQIKDQKLVICSICAYTCHKGHNLKPGNYGLPAKIVCDCGQGKFSKCAQANAQKLKNKNCTALRNNYKNLVEKTYSNIFEDQQNKIKEIKQNKNIKTEGQRIEEILLYYSDQKFLEDLVDALELPDYFGCVEDLQLLEDKKLMFDSSGSLLKLYDMMLNRGITLIENLLLLSAGRVTESFMTILSSMNDYNYGDYNNQIIFQDQLVENLQVLDAHQTTSLYLGDFNALNSFIAMIQVDFHKLQRYGQGFVDVMGESGSIDESAKDKIFDLLLMSNGGNLPKYVDANRIQDQEAQQKIRPNKYFKVLQKLFGVNGKKVLSLHKLLQLNKRELIELCSNETNDEEVKNNQDWIFKDLMSNELGLEDDTIEWFKNITRLSCQDFEGLNFIMQEKNTHPLKAQMYKAFLTRSQYELQSVFEKLNTFIPMEFNNFLFQIWSFNRKEIVQFPFLYDQVNQTFQKNWQGVIFENIKDIYQNNYLENLFSIMTGESIYLEQKMSSILVYTGYQSYDIKLQDVANVSNTTITMVYDQLNIKSRYPDLYRQISVLVSVHGVFSNVQIEIPQMANYFNRTVETVIEEQELQHLVSICNTQWDDDDVKFVLNKLQGSSRENINLNRNIPIKDEQIKMAQQLLLASEGYLDSLGTVADEIFARDGNHIRSLLATSVCGISKFTSFDQKLSKDQKKLRVNLMIREMHYIYEKICRLSFPNLAQKQQQPSIIMNQYQSEDYIQSYDDFMKFSFNQKLPQHLYCSIAQDIDIVNHFFDPSQEFCSNFNKTMKQNCQNSQIEQQKYLSMLLEYLTAMNSGQNIQSIIRKMSGKQPSDKIKISIKQLPANLQQFNEYTKITFNEIKIDQNAEQNKNLFNELEAEIIPGEVKVELNQLLELIMQCLSGEQKAFVSLNLLFSHLFQNIPLLAHLFSILAKLIDNKKKQIFDNLDAITAIMIVTFKKQLLKNQGIQKKDEKLITAITQWMEAIIIMLDKETLYDSQTIEQKLTDTIKTTLEFYEPDPNSQVEMDNVFKNNNYNVTLIVDILKGVISMSQQKFENMEKMSVKIGGFPTTDKITEFFSITQKHVKVLEFGLSKAQNQVQTKQAAPTIKSMDTNVLFDFFSKNTNGVVGIGIEEFKNVCRSMGLKGSTRELKIFALVDTSHTGNLNAYQFSKAMSALQLIVVKETIEALGMTMNDMILEFCWIIAMLLMMFVFIFIGIAAFSPVTTFAGIMNSVLVGFSGLFANKKGDDGQKEISENDASNAATEIITDS